MEKVLVREFNSTTDKGRLAELWGNLCMIQQMRGTSVWMQGYQQSGLSWSEYLLKLISGEGSKVLVFIMQDILFGFTLFTVKENLATIREFYLEPGYKNRLDADLLINDIKVELKNQNVQYLEFDIKDL